MISALVNLIVHLLILGVLYWIVLYVLDAIPIPDPPNRIIKIVLTVILALVLILVLLNIFGLGGGIDLPKLSQ